MMKITKGYKNLNKDWTCRSFKFEVGKTYKQKGLLKMCSNGFHFHINPFDLFTFYNFNDSIVVEIEAYGDVITEKNKSVCSEIKIIREISGDDLKLLGNMITNSGWGNSGNWNSGHYNSGDRNSGHYNSGDWNSGDRNSGDWNSCNHSRGFFNSKTQDEILVFNKPCLREDFDDTIKPDFIYNISLTKFISTEAMSEKEKEENPNYIVI